MAKARFVYTILILCAFALLARQALAEGMDWENYWQAGKQLLQDGQYQQSMVLMKKGADEIDTAGETEKPSGVIQSIIYMDLAEATLLVEQYELAEDYMTISLQKMEQTREGGHPDVARCLSRLAQVYAKQGRYTEAEDLYGRAINIAADAFGTEYYVTAGYRNQLGHVYAAQGKYVESAWEYQKALAIVHFPGASEITAYIDAISALSLLYYKTESPDKIDDLFQQAIDTVKRTRGKEHPDMAVLLAAEADTYADTGDVDAADQLLQQAIAIHENALGPTDSGLARYWVQLIKLCLRSHRLSQAYAYAKQTFTIMPRNDNVQYAELLFLQATIQFQQDQLLDAGENARKSKELYVNIFGETHSTVVLVDDLIASINGKQ